VSCQTHIKFNYHLERLHINTFYGMFIYRCSNGGKHVVTNAYKTIKIHNSRCEFCRSLYPHHHRGSEMTNYHKEGLFSKTIVVYNLISISSTTYSYTTYLEETYFERNPRCHYLLILIVGLLDNYINSMYIYRITTIYGYVNTFQTVNNVRGLSKC